MRTPAVEEPPKLSPTISTEERDWRAKPTPPPASAASSQSPSVNGESEL